VMNILAFIALLLVSFQDVVSINCDIAFLSNTELDASVAIQDCINTASSGDEVVLPPGKYVLESGLQILKPLVLRSGGNESCGLSIYSSCANLVASPTFYSAQGMVQIVSGVSNVVMDRLVIDGNRDSRLHSQSATEVIATTKNA
jgi:hypothetical protein